MTATSTAPGADGQRVSDANLTMLGEIGYGWRHGDADHNLPTLAEQIEKVVDDLRDARAALTAATEREETLKRELAAKTKEAERAWCEVRQVQKACSDQLDALEAAQRPAQVTDEMVEKAAEAICTAYNDLRGGKYLNWEQHGEIGRRSWRKEAKVAIEAALAASPSTSPDALRREERERCAKIAEEHTAQSHDPWIVQQDIAAAIRAEPRNEGDV